MSSQDRNQIHRRDAFRGVAAGAVAAAAMGAGHSAVAKESDAPSEAFRASSKRVKHSVMAWCFKPFDMEELVAACSKVGMAAMEGIEPKYYPLMKKHGLGVSLVSSHGFAKGPVSKDNWEYCEKKLKEAVDLAVEWNCKNVITFTGMREKGMSDKQAETNCVEFWKSQVEYAESKGVTFAFEHLNTRDDSHPMKGHPGYFGDDVDHCIDMIKRVGSPNFKLLFDVYHVQIMNGDVIRRFRQYKDHIAHVHTAGCPGRGEMDDSQEINYPAVIKAILDTGYDGYIVQEFIPNWDDKLAAMRHGVMVSDVA